MSNRYLGSVTVLLGAVSYGVSGPFAKLAFKNGLSVGELLSSMFFVSMVIFWAILPFTSRKFHGLVRSDLWKIILLGGVGLGATVAFYYISINELTVSIAIVLLFQFTWMVFLIDWIRKRRRPKAYELISLLLVLIGTISAVQLKWGFWIEGSLWGYIAGIIAAVCYAIYLNLNAEVAVDVSAIARCTIMSTSAFLFISILHPPSYLFDGQLFHLGIWPLLSGVLNQVFPPLLMAIGIPLIGSVLPGILAAIELPIGVFASNLILGERITGFTWLGIILILAGICIAGLIGNEPPRKKLPLIKRRREFFMTTKETVKDLEFHKARGFGKNIGFGENACLLVIDMINGFTDVSMPMGSDLSSEIEVTNKILDIAHNQNLPVVFTTISYDEGSLSDSGIWFQKMEGLKTLKSGTNAVELDSRLRFQKGDNIMIKKYASAFFGTDLISRLNAQKIDTVIIVGCTTCGCVRATVVDALQNGYRPIIIQDAVGDRSKLSHEQSLFDMSQKYGDVMTSNKVIERLSSLTSSNSIETGVLK
jgi:maleamate amidohydrolase